MTTPHRMAPPRRPVACARPTDGPFAETKELIGGGAFTHAHPRDHAAAVAARHRCVICGRPVNVRLLEDSASAHHPHGS